MTKDELFKCIRKKSSFLCVGLDSDINQIPSFLKKERDPLFEFNKRIVSATKDYAVAYKLNLAFYEVLKDKGIASLEKTVDFIRINYPGLFLIADAKRGDIGNSSKFYAKAYLKEMDFDAITVSPYMGLDSLVPFFQFDGKWVIILALTSNSGSHDFQLRKDTNGIMLFEEILQRAKELGSEENTMFVIGATNSQQIENVRKIVPDNFLLVPGIGAQGGSLDEVVKFGMNDYCGLLINSSRNIIYADTSNLFDIAAHEAARQVKVEMEATLVKKFPS